VAALEERGPEALREHLDASAALLLGEVRTHDDRVGRRPTG
jgi:hypothetical protein